MSYFNLFISSTWILFFSGQIALGQELNDIVNLAYNNNPGIAATKKIAEAEDSLVFATATLDDPMIGISNLNRNMSTQYGTISQKIRFPVKYYLQAKAQRSKANGSLSQISHTRLKVRQRVASLYYAIYSNQKIVQLTKANVQAVKEVSRIAEKKYASGKSSQGDSMKAHFELTQLELELIRLDQRGQSLQDELRGILNDYSFGPLDLSKKKLGVPKFMESLVSNSDEELSEILSINSPNLRKELHGLKAAEWNSTLSKWEFAPDIQLQYQQRISGMPEDSKIYSVGITFPLWFWKKGAKASAASSLQMAQEYKVRQTTLNLITEVRNLKTKTSAIGKTLRIYQTSLIPQASGAFNSTRASYRANKTSFLDLLDSERSLYRVKTGFYKNLEQYVKNLTNLETHLGYVVSNLDNNNEVKK